MQLDIGLRHQSCRYEQRVEYFTLCNAVIVLCELVHHSSPTVRVLEPVCNTTIAAAITAFVAIGDSMLIIQ